MATFREGGQIASKIIERTEMENNLEAYKNWDIC